MKRAPLSAPLGTGYLRFGIAVGTILANLTVYMIMVIILRWFGLNFESKATRRDGDQVCKVYIGGRHCVLKDLGSIWEPKSCLSIGTVHPLDLRQLRSSASDLDYRRVYERPELEADTLFQDVNDLWIWT